MTTGAGKTTEGLVSLLTQLAALGMGKFREEILHMELVSIWRRILKDCGGGRGIRSYSRWNEYYSHDTWERETANVKCKPNL